MPLSSVRSPETSRANISNPADHRISKILENKKQKNKIQSFPAFFKGPKIFEPKTISSPIKPLLKFLGGRTFPRRWTEPL
ncbi:predicted protein [Methanosarcina acetivorans C2A]|uniref:Uncharacterized protein n=1 Tax=Methanosarcina acetivorans (strain ATCC 35395 / DSM 2834 / JCM 12185 / C2A) TaxID=188937 RepID=Q8TI43_METAC|nr:predicted protein [Methanosarcina acetivorans C2A]